MIEPTGWVPVWSSIVTLPRDVGHSILGIFHRGVDDLFMAMTTWYSVLVDVSAGGCGRRIRRGYSVAIDTLSSIEPGVLLIGLIAVKYFGNYEENYCCDMNANNNESNPDT